MRCILRVRLVSIHPSPLHGYPTMATVQESTIIETYSSRDALHRSSAVFCQDSSRTWAPCFDLTSSENEGAIPGALRECGWQRFLQAVVYGIDSRDHTQRLRCPLDAASLSAIGQSACPTGQVDKRGPDFALHLHLVTWSTSRQHSVCACVAVLLPFLRAVSRPVWMADNSYP